MDEVDSIVRKNDRPIGHLHCVLTSLPDICIERLTAGPYMPYCDHCRKVIHGGLRNNAESEAEAVERVLYHIANQDCDGTEKLRRQEALRILDGLGVQGEGGADELYRYCQKIHCYRCAAD